MSDDDKEILKKYLPDIPLNDDTEEWDDGTPDGVLNGGNVTSKVPTNEQAVYADDVSEKQQKRIYPSPTYCTPEYVYMTLGLWDQRLQRPKLPSDTDVQDIDYINMNILAVEDYIDHATFNTWRAKKVKDRICVIRDYAFDKNNRLRMQMMREGGNYIVVHRDILPWDPEQGDRLYYRKNQGGNWEDWTDRVQRGFDDKEHALMWFDYDRGIMRLRPPLFTLSSQVRISYRYGNPGDVPYDIQRACGLLVAIQLLQADWYTTKLGTGGDLGGNVDRRIAEMRKEANMILSFNQRTTASRPSHG